MIIRNYQYLKSFAQRGFSGSNLRKLKKTIGEQEYSKLLNCWREVLHGEKPFGDEVMPMLQDEFTRIFNNSGNLELNLKVRVDNIYSCPYNPEKIEGKDINFEHIKQVINDFKSNVLKQYSKPLDTTALEPKTLKILYSPKYNYKAGLNQDGYYVTTIIDKKTKESVPAYIKIIEKNEFTEKWGIYVKRDKEYEYIGQREFGIDKHKRAVTSRWMDAYGHEKYAGIGLRAHQIGIERMLQEGFTKIEIQAEAQAFPFHYKAGFRVPNKSQPLPYGMTGDYFINMLAESTGLSKEQVAQCIKIRTQKGISNVKLQDIEQLRILSYLENNGKILFDETPMVLDSTHLNEWIERIKAQPIFITGNVPSILINKIKNYFHLFHFC